MWELQCEGFCVMGERGDPIRIGALERFIADWAAENLDLLQLVDTEYRPRAQRVAVVGAGPAGLAVSHFLARKGYPVTVFEAWALPGGVMAYGIPEYVLPQQVIDREVARLEALGVEFRTGVRVGRDLTLDELLQTYDAVFVGTGANEPATLGIPGEELEGVWTAKEFLMRVQASQMADRLADRLPAEEMSPPRVGRRVAVVGAGNTAMDAARTARRLGADEVTVVYRRDEAQSPSRPVEIDHAKTEGVRFQYLVNPVRFLGDEAGRLRAMELIRMELGPPDGSGRPRPVPVPGSEFQMPVDTVIVAVGYAPERELAARGGLATTSWGGFGGGRGDGGDQPARRVRCRGLRHGRQDGDPRHRRGAPGGRGDGAVSGGPGSRTRRLAAGSPDQGSSGPPQAVTRRAEAAFSSARRARR